MSSPVIFGGISQIKEAIASSSIADVVNEKQEHIKRYNPFINAIVFQNPDIEQEIEYLESMDESTRKSMPLFGVPITVKDVWCTKNMPTTSGHKPLSNYYAPQDATIVSRLKKAGAIILGKTNTPELATDLQTDNAVYGRTNNPWDLTKTVGGSSGGSAAAVVSGMSTLGFGSDIGGSMRIPAHYNGVFSIKASEHLIPATGHIPDLPDDTKTVRYMNSFGVMGRSIEDIITTLPIIAGPDNQDQDVPPIPLNQVNLENHKLKLAWTDNLGNIPIEQQMKQVIHQQVEVLETSDISIEQYLPETFDVHLLWNIWGRLMVHMVGAQIPRYVRPVARAIIKFSGQHSPLTNPFKRSISLEKLYRVLEERDQQILFFNKFLSDFDALILPVSSTVAFDHMKPTFKIGSLPVYRNPIYVDKEPLQYFMATEAYVNPFNAMGVPVVIIPIGFTSAGLPVGIQVVGKKYEDMKLLEIARILSNSISNMGIPEMNFG